MQLQHTAAATGHPTLLVTDYLTPPMAQRLREQKQQFADAAGNAYLEGPGLVLFVTGRKPQAVHVAPNAGKAYTLTGLKVTFALLCDPQLANAPHRAIAAAAGVALGAIPAVLADLQQAGHLLVLAQQRRLHATKRLLDEWAMNYARRLRAKTLQAAYAVKDFRTWPQWPLGPQALWGGEPAAHLLVKYLTPGVLTVYADRLPPKLLVQQQMTLVRGAHPDAPMLEWRKPFWGQMAAAARPDTVHPVLVYADLLATGDARCMETAQLVYDQHLARLLPAA
ncbi:MAG: type IV toxin-antitoxin system AbiEi family antitoxin [Betaproteobacteria bacterium]